MVSGIDDRALILGYERVLVERELVDFLDHVLQAYIHHMVIVV